MYCATLSKKLPHLSQGHFFWKADTPTCISLSMAPHGYKSQCSSLSLPVSCLFPFRPLSSDTWARSCGPAQIPWLLVRYSYTVTGICLGRWMDIYHLSVGIGHFNCFLVERAHCWKQSPWPFIRSAEWTVAGQRWEFKPFWLQKEISPKTNESLDGHRELMV